MIEHAAYKVKGAACKMQHSVFYIRTLRLVDTFTVVCSVTWPLDDSEARVDLVLIQTSPLLLCKTSCSDAN